MEDKKQDIANCDVQNKKLLEKYRSVVKEIRKILINESDNSIQSMIHSLNWNDIIS